MTESYDSSLFRCRTREVVQSFLQTAVILDDLAEMRAPEHHQSREQPHRDRIRPGYGILSEEEDLKKIRDPRDVPLDAQAVIDGFAEIGSVCAVLRPLSGEEYHQRTVTVASRADIVILDWKIHDTTGDEALNLLRDILISDRLNYRLRLLAIYTGEPNLRGVSDRVQATISEFYENDQMDASNPYRISKGPLQIVILAKKGIPRENGSGASQETAEVDLATQLVNEFAGMTEGLLRNVALSGISALRRQSHRILTRFDRHLDPAYLGHRQMLPNPADAEDHLAEALAAEILSILGDERPGEQANGQAIKEWLSAMESNGLDLADPYAFPGDTSPVHGWYALLTCGVESEGATRPEGAGVKTLARFGTRAYAKDSAQALHSDRSFAALLSLKAEHEGRVPRLTLGTIVRENHGSHRYLLSLQPKCDSIRLAGATGFPLIPLKANGNNFRLAVDVGEGAWIHFGIVLKPSELILLSFEPRSDDDGEILASCEAKKWQFKDVNGKTYHWIAEMKDEYALMLAGDVASSLSRPGPNISEWLRRASRQ